MMMMMMIFLGGARCALVDRVARRGIVLLRLLQQESLRDLQAEINMIIQDVQNVTADPKVRCRNSSAPLLLVACDAAALTVHPSRRSTARWVVWAHEGPRGPRRPPNVTEYCYNVL